MTIEHFLDKERGKKIDIDEFPFLFSLQIRTGISGIVFSAVWFGIVTVSYRDFWNIYTSLIAAFIIGGFLAMVLLGNLYSQKVVDRSLYERSAADWDFYARWSMMILIILFSVICSILIWFTGGMSSPFISFYVMVYTLTLTRCALPHPGRELLILYAALFASAGLLAGAGLLTDISALAGGSLVAHDVLPPKVDAVIIQSIKQGKEREVTEFLFALAAMIVPYWSTLSAERREELRKKHAAAGRLGGHEGGSGPGTPPSKTG